MSIRCAVSKNVLPDVQGQGHSGCFFENLVPAITLLVMMGFLYHFAGLVAMARKCVASTSRDPRSKVKVTEGVSLKILSRL